MASRHSRPDTAARRALAVTLGVTLGHLATRATVGGRAWWLARRRLRLESATLVGGARLAYRVGRPVAAVPHAVPLVCVPGLAVSSRYFVPLMAALSRTHSVWGLHPPGHAGSDAGPWPVSMEGYGHALLALLTTLPAPPVLIANSMGCQVAMRVAAQHPDRVRALVLIGPTTDPRARSWLAQGARLLRSIPYDQRAIDLTVASDYVHTGFVRGVRELRAMLRDGPEHVAGQVRCPVLLLRGEHDYVAPRRWLQQLAGLLPRAAVQEIERAGHAVHFTQAARVAALCRRFVASLPAR